MRWLALCGLLFAACAFAQVTRPSIRPEVGGGDLPPIVRVAQIVDSIDPAQPATALRAEEALIAMGPMHAAAISAELENRTAQLETAQRDGRANDALRLAAQTQALDRTVIRLTVGFNPPALIRAWLMAQVPAAQQLAKTMPEPVRVVDANVDARLPQYLFYVVRIPQYPVARVLPEPMAAINLFAVKRELPEAADGEQIPPGMVSLITEIERLKGGFMKNSAPIIPINARLTPQGIEDAMKSTTAAWLRLSAELHNDGMYRFVIPLETLQLAANAGAGGYTVTGRAEAVPTGGNSGTITATLTFDPARKLTGIEEEVKLKAGMRPICQATKLLDPDPIVRKMAEQDLLVMGPAAYDYLQIRRAEATPELQAAIDRIWQRILERERQ